jgi:hypothetical protein
MRHRKIITIGISIKIEKISNNSGVRVKPTDPAIILSKVPGWIKLTISAKAMLNIMMAHNAESLILVISILVVVIDVS